jgi:hypothetical protein
MILTIFSDSISGYIVPTVIPQLLTLDVCSAVCELFSHLFWPTATSVLTAFQHTLQPLNQNYSSKNYDKSKNITVSASFLQTCLNFSTTRDESGSLLTHIIASSTPVKMHPSR